MDILNLLCELRFEAKYDEAKELADKLIKFITFENENVSFNSKEGKIFNSKEGKIFNSKEGENFNSKEGETFNSKEAETFNSKEAENVSFNSKEVKNVSFTNKNSNISHLFNLLNIQNQNEQIIFILKSNVEYLKKILRELTLISFYIEDDKTFGQLYYDILWMIFNEKYTNNMEFYLNQIEFDQNFSISDQIPYIQLLKNSNNNNNDKNNKNNKNNKNSSIIHSNLNLNNDDNDSNDNKNNNNNDNNNNLPIINSNNVPKYPHNPSIVKLNSNNINQKYYIINIRLTNSYKENGEFVAFPTDKIIKSENILVIGIQNEKNILEYVKSFKIKEKEKGKYFNKNVMSQYQGLEDIRLFWNKKEGKKVLSFLAHIPNEKDGRTHCYGYFPQIVKNNLLLLFNENEVYEYILEVWPCVFAGRSDKNILKIKGPNLHFIYSTNPFINCEWNSNTNKLYLKNLKLSNQHQKYIQCDNRGSAGLIKFYNKYLGIFHSHIDKNNTRLYIYRFVLFNNSNNNNETNKSNKAKNNSIKVNNSEVNNSEVNNSGVNNSGVNNSGVNNSGVNNTGVNNTGVNKINETWEIESYSKWFYISLTSLDFIISMEHFGNDHLIIGYGKDDHVDMFGVIHNKKIIEMLQTNTKIPDIQIIDFK
jgi:hypothetical protein